MILLILHFFKNIFSKIKKKKIKSPKYGESGESWESHSINFSAVTTKKFAARKTLHSILKQFSFIIYGKVETNH